jgi:hypothetical protein
MELAVIFRIQKLLALANDKGATEAEANLAMEKAQAIMSEHNLTMATIAATGEKGQESRTKEGLDGQALFDYQRDLMNAIAATNYCYVSVLYKHTRRGSRGAGYRLIGTESNVASAKIMFEYLMQTINRLVMQEINNDYRQRMSRYAISWCTGCASRLRERIEKRHDDFLKEQARQAEEQRRQAQHPASASHGALIVVMEDYAQKERDLNDDYRNGWEPGTTAANRTKQEAQRKAAYEKKYAAAIAKGFDHKTSDAYAQYYFESMEAAHKWAHPEKKTAEEQAKDDAYWEREYRKERNRQRREESKRNWTAYAKGQDAGDSISLNRQVDKGTATKSIK